MLAQQLPPLTKFNGENCDGEGETFQDWIEQFEMVATVCRWDDQAKLVNLVTRLKGQAYSFFRSCTPQQRMSYHSLTTELGKRFTPVRIQVVQTSLFHERRQGSTESVDDFAQDLRSLFYKAYPRAHQGALEVVGMGQSVLANQFVSGLRTDIKAKVAGSEGGFDQLLAKARFEEAKLRDLSGCKPRSTIAPSPRPVFNPPQSQHSQSKQGGAQDLKLASKTNQSNVARCYTCGSTAHLAKRCPARKGSGPAETPGRGHRPGGSQIANITPSHESTQEPRAESVAELRQRLQEAEAKEAVGEFAATMYGVTLGETRVGPHLGPTPTAEVELEGERVEALLDTGSPVTIVSLSFLLQLLARKRPTD